MLPAFCSLHWYACIHPKSVPDSESLESRVAHSGPGIPGVSVPTVRTGRFRSGEPCTGRGNESGGNRKRIVQISEGGTNIAQIRRIGTEKRAVRGKGGKCIHEYYQYEEMKGEEKKIMIVKTINFM